jgi:hypothetical protein
MRAKIQPDMIGEWIKGLVYAIEPQRLFFVTEDWLGFDGRHDAHSLRRADDTGTWGCSCFYYWGSRTLPGGPWCRHTIALRCILAFLRLGIRLPVRRAAGVRQDPHYSIKNWRLK